MTNDEQRIAIAEACGWSSIEDCCEPLMTPFRVWKGYPPEGALIENKLPLPDSLSDLHEMHEVAKSLLDGVPAILGEVGAAVARITVTAGSSY